MKEQQEEENSMIEFIKSSKVRGEIVKERVVEQLVEESIEERAGKIRKALKKYDRLVKEVRKLTKPDIVTYDEEGNKSLSYSSENYVKLQKAKSGVKGIDDAIERALSQGDYGPLDKIIQSEN